MSYTMDKDLLALETAGKDQHNYSAIQQLYSVSEVRARQAYFIQQLQKFSYEISNKTPLFRNHKLPTSIKIKKVNEMINYHLNLHTMSKVLEIHIKSPRRKKRKTPPCR